MEFKISRPVDSSPTTRSIVTPCRLTKITLIVASMLFVGCLNHTVRADYESLPPTMAEGEGEGASLALQISSMHQEGVNTRIGVMKNSVGWEVGDVLLGGPFNEWFFQELSARYGHAGFSTSRQSDEAPVEVQVDVVQYFAEGFPQGLKYRVDTVVILDVHIEDRQTGGRYSHRVIRQEGTSLIVNPGDKMEATLRRLLNDAYGEVIAETRTFLATRTSGPGLENAALF